MGMSLKKLTGQRGFPSPGLCLCVPRPSTQRLQAAPASSWTACVRDADGRCSTFLFSSGTVPPILGLAPCFFRPPWMWLALLMINVRPPSLPLGLGCLVCDAPQLRPSVWVLHRAGFEPFCSDLMSCFSCEHVSGFGFSA